jgi:hypothetical protein
MHATQNTPAPVDTERTPAGVLRDAADYIEAHGWHQGSLYDWLTDADVTLPPACAAGALYHVGWGYDRPTDWVEESLHPRRTVTFAAFRLLAGYLVDTGATTVPLPHAEILAAYEEVIGGWNDHDDRTITEVTQTLRGAADEWDRIHGGAS